MSNTHIVITSIFPPTLAVRSFAARPEMHLTVVGDRKSPESWECDGAQFLSVDDQAKMGGPLSGALPFNHYCRKLLGYVQAARQGADVIIDTDDDNLPRENFGFPHFDAAFQSTPDDLGYVNVYANFTTQRIWPRGFPLGLLANGFEPAPVSEKVSPVKVGVWQGLADDDPDVDAIYRLTSDEACFFDDRAPFVLGEGSLCPFNSQNTAFRREVFPLLYLPSTVTFRYTDILRGYVAQPILWAHGYRLGFLSPRVRQIRNPHDYMVDFESEVPMFLSSERAVETTKSVVSSANSIEDNLHRAYVALRDQGIVGDAEIPRLEAWLTEIIP